MPPTPSRRLHLAAGGDASAPRSPAQQLFASLTGRIDAQRALLAEWAAAIEAYDQRYAQDYLPLHAQYRDLHVELLDFLDVAASGGMRLGRTDLQALHELIADMAAGLLLGEDDPARRDRLDALLDKYASPAPQAPEDDDGPDAVLRRVEAEASAARADAEAARAAHHAQRRRKGTAREQRARRQSEEAVQASQSVRAVYRQLVSALHPDREPDEQERLRKTALMQRVNQAYAANRLLDLLQLQLEIEQIDAGHIDGLGDARLGHYNRMLADQLAELQQEVRAVEADFKARHGLNPHGRLRPALVAGRLRHEMARLHNAIRALQQERRLLADADFFKRWVRAQRQMDAP